MLWTLSMGSSLLAWSMDHPLWIHGPSLWIKCMNHCHGPNLYTIYMNLVHGPSLFFPGPWSMDHSPEPNPETIPVDLDYGSILYMDLVYGPYLWTWSMGYLCGPGLWAIPVDLVYGPSLWTWTMDHPCFSMGYGPWIIPVDPIFRPSLWTWTIDQSYINFGPGLWTIPVDLVYEPSLWTWSMDRPCGPGLWTIPVNSVHDHPCTTLNWIHSLCFHFSIYHLSMSVKLFFSGWWGRCESSKPDLYLPRYNAIINLIASQTPSIDVVCLQEFWFHDDIMELFDSQLDKK